MRKFFIFLSIFVSIFVSLPFSLIATETSPVYDSSYDNNKGAFYANGNDIIIDTNRK